jgi:hypothetical protein
MTDPMGHRRRARDPDFGIRTNMAFFMDKLPVRAHILWGWRLLTLP